ncbi:MAG: hypothetical protein ACNY01_13820, partial [Desulfobacteria bacterium]
LFYWKLLCDKREFPNVTGVEIDNLEQDDYLLLIEYITEANKGLTEQDEEGKEPTDFTNPAITTA